MGSGQQSLWQLCEDPVVSTTAGIMTFSKHFRDVRLAGGIPTIAFYFRSQRDIPNAATQMPRT